MEGKIIKHRALFAGEDWTRHVLSFSVPLETFRFSDRVDKKESQYLQITGSVYHSHVTLKSLARINAAERSGVCLAGRVWGVCGENTPILNMVMLSVRRDVQLNADIGGGELGHGRHRYADAE